MLHIMHMRDHGFILSSPPNPDLNPTRNTKALQEFNQTYPRYVHSAACIPCTCIPKHDVQLVMHVPCSWSYLIHAQSQGYRLNP